MYTTDNDLAFGYTVRDLLYLHLLNGWFGLHCNSKQYKNRQLDCFDLLNISLFMFIDQFSNYFVKGIYLLIKKNATMQQSCRLT